MSYGLIGLMFAVTLAAQPVSQNDASIAGRVSNLLSGAPIRKARVVLTSSSPSVRLSADSDAEGGFQFTGLPPGTYRLSATRTGFLGRPARRVITLGSGESVTGAEVRLPPYGVISGRVLDEDDDPEPAARIYIYKQVYQNARRRWERVNNSFQAGDRGEYRVPNLVPGRYLVQAFTERAGTSAGRYDEPGAASRSYSFYPPAYYPRATARQQAVPVDVGIGTEVGGIDIHLFKLTRPPLVHVRGRIAGIPPNSSVDVGVSLAAADEAPFNGGTTMAHAPSYAFDLTAPPGHYTLRANVYSGGADAYGSVTLFVGGDLDGVTLNMTPAPVVVMRVTAAEGKGAIKLQGVKARLFSADSHNVYDLRADSAGDMTFPLKAWPGERLSLTVDTTSLPEGWYVQKIRFAGNDIFTGDFEIQGSGALEIVLRSGAGNIAGTVVDSDGKLYPNSSVTLIPDDSDSLPVRQAVDDNGGFRFVALAPGRYKLFAWEEVDDDLWQDPEFRRKYQSRAAAVTVAAGESQSLRIAVIAAEEMK